MDVERFQRELACIPVVTDWRNLPPELRAALEQNEQLKGLVDDRIECDLLLADLPDLVPPQGFAAETVRRALGVDAVPRRGRRWGTIASRAAILLVGVGLGVWLAKGWLTPEQPSAELLAQLDVLLDWELIESEQETLDLMLSADLLEAVGELDEVIDVEEGE